MLTRFEKSVRRDRCAPIELALRDVLQAISKQELFPPNIGLPIKDRVGGCLKLLRDYKSL